MNIFNMFKINDTELCHGRIDELEEEFIENLANEQNLL